MSYSITSHSRAAAKSLGVTIKRAAYKKRHSKNRSVVGSNGYYADKILW